MIKYFDFEKDIEKIDNEISSIDQTDISKKEKLDSLNLKKST